MKVVCGGGRGGSGRTELAKREGYLGLCVYEMREALGCVHGLVCADTDRSRWTLR